jgi:hypothetical protein
LCTVCTTIDPFTVLYILIPSRSRYLARPIKPFTPPSLPDVRATYARAEVRFLWANLNYLRLSGDAKTKLDGLILYTQPQRDALERLDRCLLRGKLDIAKASKAKYDSLEALYFPSESMSLRALKPFTSPVKVYMALLCLYRGEGQRYYANLWDLCPSLSQLQFDIRLTGFHRLLVILHEMNDEGLLTTGDDPQWLE